MLTMGLEDRCLELSEMAGYFGIKTTLTFQITKNNPGQHKFPLNPLEFVSSAL